MNTINLGGKVFDLVPRQTIIAEEIKKEFTMPHDINSEVKPISMDVVNGVINGLNDNVDTTPTARAEVHDANGIHDEIIDTLNQRDMKGINKYGNTMMESKLSISELLDYGFEKSLDDLQSNRVTKQRVEKVIDLLEPHEEIPFIGEALKLIRGTKEDI